VRVSILVSERPKATIGLTDFCSRVGDLIYGVPRAEVPGRIAALLPSILANRDLLTPAQCALPPSGYGRHDIFVCPSGMFSVVAAVWPAGIMSAIHDHRTWCAFGVYSGVMREILYAPLEPESRHVRPIETVDCRPGDVRHLPVDRPDIHAMHNPTDRAAISIHVYGEAALGPNVGKVYSLPG
jgi:predicted metal-dependent enzyme (double-stranded beta helix superfamily)